MKERGSKEKEGEEREKESIIHLLIWEDVLCEGKEIKSFPPKPPKLGKLEKWGM